ncbi:Uncharacterised protein [Hungatella hathewayi]|nr:Uncharacterised protein [Hungatella hathewayi]
MKKVRTESDTRVCLRQMLLFITESLWKGTAISLVMLYISFL